MDSHTLPKAVEYLFTPLSKPWRNAQFMMEFVHKLSLPADRRQTKGFPRGLNVTDRSETNKI